MNWFDILKDIPSHTTFISGPKPKGKFDTKPIEDLFVRHIMGRMRKFNPKNWKDILGERVQSIKNIAGVFTGANAKAFYRDVIEPRLDADPNLKYRDAYTLKELATYTFKRTHPELFLEEEK